MPSKQQKKYGLKTKENYYDARIKPKLSQIYNMASKYVSNRKMAALLQVGYSTFKRYIEEYEELSQTIEDGRNEAIATIENALFKKAKGYYFIEQVKERKFNADKGKYEMVITKKYRKHEKPDIKAIEYFLEQRAGDRWQRNPEPGIDTDRVNEHVASIADLLNSPEAEREIGSEEE
jgi:hypothetical protein